MPHYEKISISAQRLANLVLDIATYLLASGAHCGRVNRNINRIANVWGFDVHLQLTFKGVLTTVKDRNNPINVVTRYQEAPEHSIHLNVISEVSALSWCVHDNHLGIDEVEKQFAEIKAIKSYNTFTIALAVAFSCAGLCLFSQGDYLNALVAFAAAFVGYLVRSAIAKLDYNAMISISVAAFVTTLITSIATTLNIGTSPEAAMATAVLYLIPGVPLINSVIDLIEGYISSSINRMLFGGFTLLCIAAGMTMCITLIGIDYFN